MVDQPLKSLVVVAPADLWPTVKMLNAGLGYTISDGVPLTPIDGDGTTITHRATLTPSGEEYNAIATGQVTPIIEGVTAQQIQGVLAQLTVSVEQTVIIDGKPVVLIEKEHFDYIIQSMGLKTLEETI